jgi:hypothetical protein
MEQCSEKTLLLDDLSLDPDAGIELYNSGTFDTVIIPDPKLCGANQSEIEGFIKRKFSADEYIFEYYYFANDPDACILNAVRDPKPGGTLCFIRAYSKRYRIPPNSTILPVYKEIP